MESAVLKTLVYHDLFDYPLTAVEIHRFLIGKKASLKKIKSTVDHLPLTTCQDGYYFLKNRPEIINYRKKRGKFSLKKLKRAQKIIYWLKLIPTVKMVALTGAVAVGNASQADDIDFLIVTAKDRLWLTRLALVLLIELLGIRRRPKSTKARDKICLNIFIEENNLLLPRSKRNLFTAHEITQMKVLWQKNNLYQKFIKTNQWLEKFLPNWKP